MGDSVGRVDLDLNLNQQGFNRQLQGIQGMAKKAGALIVGAFAVKGLFDFGKKALELGSDLNEVQNVVDVTFTSMSDQVNKFAQEAAASFGLSETMAKKFTGTFGAMGKAFGFSEKQAYDMATALTGLSGDVASFYNISQDEAYTKLKSVFTGETESLKDLGIVMTQSALDSYAMANGFGKTTQAMSENEKVALRFAFVQEQLSLANGDFARTSGGWANQVRILKLQMESFMATVGQGLINVFTPVIRVINMLMGKLIQLGAMFKSFTEAFTGKKGTEKSAGDAAGAVEGIGGAAADTSKKVDKAAKEIKGSLAGFDELNVLQQDTGGNDAGTDESSGAGGMDVGAMDMELGSGTTVSPEVNKAAETIKAIFGGVKFWYNKNFAPLFANIGTQIKPEIEEFQKNFSGVFSDVKYLGAPLKAWFNNDFTPYLQQEVKTWGGIVVGLFDSFNMVFFDIWNLAVFPILQNFLTVGLPIITQFWTQTSTIVWALFVEVKRIFDLIWSTAVAPALSMITQIWTEAWATIQQAWNTWGVPIFDAIRTAIKNTGQVLQQVWTTVLQPVWEHFMEVVDWLWTNHLQPLMENFLNFVGVLISGALQIYNEVIAPLVSWFVEKLGPPIAAIIDFLIDKVGTKVAFMIDRVSAIITVLTGLVQFITGVFTGDWQKAWEGVVTVFKGIFEGIKTIVKGVMNSVIDFINLMLKAVIGGMNAVISRLNTIQVSIPDWVPGGLGGKSFGINLPKIENYQIPKLATGAVIPPNQEFLALLGDQKSGRNLEMPESLLRQIVREEGGSQGGDVNITIEASANEGQLIRYFTYKIKQEEGRRGKVLVKGAPV